MENDNWDPKYILLINLKEVSVFDLVTKDNVLRMSNAGSKFK